MRLRSLISLTLILLARTAVAQNATTVEALAPILAAEDARRFDATLLGASVRSPDSVVQKYALRALGRIGDPAGVPILAEYLANPDSGLDAEAVFALGLIRDTSAVAPIIGWLTGPVAISQDASLEGATALARIGGPTAAAFLTQVFTDTLRLRMPDRIDFLRQILAEAWRLGRRAPVSVLVDAARADHPLEDRVPATYSLARLHPVSAASDLLILGQDQSSAIRGQAVKALTRAFADSAKLPRASVATVAANALGDPDPNVRITALRSVASFRDSAYAGQVMPLVQDPSGNVEIQALEALGVLGGARAAATLRETLGSKRPWALRRQALVSLARIDAAGFRAAVPSWQNSSDWRDRAAAAEGWVAAAGGPAVTSLLADEDGRVIAAALQAWSDAAHGPDSALIAAARAHLGDADAAVRSIAADAIARAPRAGDVAPLQAAWRRAQRDSFPDAGESALGALQKLSLLPDGSGALRFAQSEPAPQSFPSLYKAWAESRWDLLSQRWGASVPVATGRTLEDYRSVTRHLILGTADQQSPHVFIDVDGKGTIELALFGADAPLTVANFLRLVDAGFFNGDRWHRVVPGFVIQDGDPRGDGWGGPGTVIRDEINRHRYRDGTVGMALSGPDTGGSQWFITVGDQPHLDGGYTVFGEVVTGGAIVPRVLQGDLIRSIHR